MAARKKRYVTEDGCYLAIDERIEGIYIAWYISEDADFGGYIGEHEEKSKTPPEKKEDWENWVVYRTIKSLADNKDSRGFVFETIKKARLALAAANEALLTGNAPWPAWAIQAKEAGWTPPKGWKP
jgi:hypothetical protein